MYNTYRTCIVRCQNFGRVSKRDVITMFSVDEKDRKNGYDPERELLETGFHDFQRRLVTDTLA